MASAISWVIQQKISGQIYSIGLDIILNRLKFRTASRVFVSILCPIYLWTLLKAILSFNHIYCGFAVRIAFDLCTSISLCGSGYRGRIAVETLFLPLLNIGPIVGWGCISNPRSPHLNLSWQSTKTEGKCVENMWRVPNSVGQCCPYNVPWLNKPLSQKIKNCVLSSFTCLGSDLGSASPDKETLNLTL